MLQVQPEICIFDNLPGETQSYILEFCDYSVRGVNKQWLKIIDDIHLKNNNPLPLPYYQIKYQLDNLEQFDVSYVAKNFFEIAFVEKKSGKISIIKSMKIYRVAGPGPEEEFAKYGTYYTYNAFFDGLQCQLCLNDIHELKERIQYSKYQDHIIYPGYSMIYQYISRHPLSKTHPDFLNKKIKLTIDNYIKDITTNNLSLNYTELYSNL